MYVTMVQRFFFIFIFFISIVAQAQIDSKNRSTQIPAIESEKDSSDLNLLSLKPNENTSINGMTIPKTNTDFGIPEKEFSMFGETFGNPGELFEKRLKKHAEDMKPEGNGVNTGLKEDTFWGDYRTKSKYVEIAYKDFELVDGDLLMVIIDDEVVRPSASLTSDFKGFRLELKEGFNKIDFYAVNEGAMSPNTAEYAIIDQWKNVISNRVWALSKGVKVTVIIVKE